MELSARECRDFVLWLLSWAGRNVLVVWRVFAVVLAVVLLAGACSAETTVGAPTQQSETGAFPDPEGSVGDDQSEVDELAIALEPELEALIAETAKTMLERFGVPETAAIVFLLAYDSGYSFDQIVDGARSGALTAEGRIDGVEPASGEGTSEGAPSQDWDAEQVRLGLRVAGLEPGDPASEVGAVILIAILAGVPRERIIEAIILDDLFPMVARAMCKRAYDGDPNSKILTTECQQGIPGPAIVEPFPADTDEPVTEQDVPAPTDPEPPVAENATIDAAASYRFRAVLDLGDETGTTRYDWEGPFNVDDQGAITGSGTVVGSSVGTCESPGLEGSVRGPYTYTVEGTFDIAGRAAEDQLEIRLANASARFTLDQGDQAILCVDISRDIALDIGRLPLGDPELGLGLLEVPASGGSTIIDTGEGIVFMVEVTPS